MVVFWGAAKRPRAAVERSSAAESLRRRLSGAARVPAINLPVSGSRTSPTALTATMAPTTASPTSHTRGADAASHGSADPEELADAGSRARPHAYPRRGRLRVLAAAAA